jgi:membrane protein required for colicin V production
MHMAFPLQPYDFLMILVLTLCALFGAWKGMAWQLAALASLVVSGLVAAHFSGPFAPYFGAEAPWNRCLAMLVLYVATSLVIWLLFRMVSSAIDRVELKEFDRQLGALFGAIKGVLWCVVITFFAVTLSEPGRQAVLKSHSGYYIAVLTARGVPLLPQEVRAVLGKYIDELDRRLDPKQPAAPAPNRQLAPPAGQKI